MSPDKIIAVARGAIGTPFRHQGRSLDTGLDCVGLACYIADACGLGYDDLKGYSRTPGNGLLEAALDGQPCLERIPAPEPGCLLLLRISRSPQHAAILAGDTLIHAWSDAGKVCEHVFDAAWRRRVVRCYRFRSIAA